ncbi:SUKH-3 domain-containing protein [Metabacillus fastidiosus]|uniref:SUKH-3 domain-containing protein n=1 Tax=Metabacillus fastidiosus TaxID=1458 RepID=UPI002E20F14E|nr:SUKH-3 domain-containing protein [Metabacillus fastidiosus]
MKTKLSGKTINILEELGWNQNSKVDLTETVRFLETMGYQIFNPVIEVLSIFGGVKYKFKHPNGSLETFHFSPEEAVGDYYEKEDFEEFEQRVKEPLVVVGEAYRGNLIMFVSKSGKVFGKNGYSLYKFGDNIFEALHTLCLFRKPEEIE